MKKILFLLLTVVLFAGTPTITAFSQTNDFETDLKDEELATILIESEDAVDTWSKFSDSEKNSVKDFASRATDLIQQLSKENISNRDLTTAINKLSHSEALAVKVFLLPVKITIEQTHDNTITTLNEYRRTAELTGENVIGVTLWTFEHSINWGFDDFGGLLTKARRNWDVSINPVAVGWSFEGVSKDEQYGGVGDVYYESDMMVQLQNSVFGIPSQTVMPRIWLEGLNDGTSSVVEYSG